MRRLLAATSLCVAVAVAVVGAGPSLAADAVPYQQSAFAAAQADKKPILIAIHAPWCPVCAKQAPILAKLEAEPAFKDVVVMRVDFDSQKDVVRTFGATMQSTLVAFHGANEKGRAVGITDEAAIRDLMAKTKG